MLYMYISVPSKQTCGNGGKEKIPLPIHSLQLPSFATRVGMSLAQGLSAVQMYTQLYTCSVEKLL